MMSDEPVPVDMNAEMNLGNAYDPPPDQPTAPSEGETA